MFNGKVVKNESVDPNYKIKFSFESDKFVIQDGEAIFTRKSPMPKIVFDGHTDSLLKGTSAHEDAIKKIELELGRTVIEYIISNTNDMNSLWVSNNFSRNHASMEPAELQRKMFINNTSRTRK